MHKDTQQYIPITPKPKDRIQNGRRRRFSSRRRQQHSQHSQQQLHWQLWKERERDAQ
jgi:hypothetical protein